MNQSTLINLFWRRFKKNRLAFLGGIIVFLFFAIAVLAPFIAPYGPDGINVKHVLEPPSLSHPFGTDDLGRDILSRVIYGSRISLAVRFVDIMLAIPTFFLILAVIAMLEPSIWNIMIVIVITSWMGVARLVRAEFLSLKEREFVLAARALGASDFRIIFRHILPNAMSPVLVSAVLGIAGAVLIESALSFLGIGVQPPTASWGNILTIGKDNIEIAWWISVFPGLAIFVTVLAYNLLGEGIRDSIYPRLKI